MKLKVFSLVWTLCIIILPCYAKQHIIKADQTLSIQSKDTFLFPQSTDLRLLTVTSQGTSHYLSWIDEKHDTQYSYALINSIGEAYVLIPPEKIIEITSSTLTDTASKYGVTLKLENITNMPKEDLIGIRDLIKGTHLIIEKYKHNNISNQDIILAFQKAQLQLNNSYQKKYMAGSSYVLGWLLRNKGDNQSSIQALEKSINYYLESGQTAYYLSALNQKGLSLWRSKQLTAALAIYQKILSQPKDQIPSNILSNALNNSGLIYWETKELEQAKRFFIQALENHKISVNDNNIKQLDKKTVLSQPANIIIPNLNNLALVYLNAGDFEQAKHLFSLIIELENIVPTDAATAKLNLADIHTKNAEYDTAIKLLNESLVQFKKLGYNYWIGLANHNLGVNFNALGLPKVALSYFTESSENYDVNNNPKEFLNSQFQIQLLDNKNDLDSLESLAKEHKQYITLSKIAEFKAQQASANHNPDLAITLIDDDLKQIQNLKFFKREADLALLKAQIHQQQGRHDQSITVIKNILGKPYSKWNSLFRSQLLNALAYSEWKSGNLPQALITIQKSADQLNILSQHVNHSKTQQQLKLHADETLTLYSMLFASEQHAAKTLSFINTTLLGWKSNQTYGKQDQATALFTQINNISFALENSRLSDETRETMEREITSLNNELDYLSTINPNKAEALDVKALQAAMNEDELTIQFMTGQYGSIAWWISKNKIICVPLENRKKLTIWVEQTRQTIADKAKLNQAIIELTDHLFSPLADYPKVKKINLILDEPLNVLPIAALPLPQSNEPMIDKFTIRSFNQLASYEKHQITETLQAVYFANPVHHSKDTRLPSETNINDITEFTPLVGTADEVKAINTLIPGQVFQGFEANKNNFNIQVKGTNILHMATHAFFNEDRPDLSALVLSAYDEHGNNQASMVRASEIRNMNLPYELVVLSGCETGLSSGNGLTGLTQSFLQAGTQNLISSLWQVDDRATSMMMTLLYQNLKLGQSIEAALRNAQIHIKNQHQTRHPKYWAGWFHISQ